MPTPRGPKIEDYYRGDASRSKKPSTVDPAIPDFTNFSNDQLEILGQVYPNLKKKLELLRTLQAKSLLIEAGNALGRSATEPVKFFTNVLGWRPTDTARRYGYKLPITPDQKLVCDSVVHHARTAVPAGHGVGKTRIAAGIVLWFLNTVKDSIVVTTASTWAQVEAQLWREIRDSHRNAKFPLPGKLLETELRIADRWFALGLSTDDPTRFRGFHSKRVLIVFDEATGVREDLWDEAESMILGPNDRFLAIGNPTDSGSRFKKACDSGLWNVIRLDSRNHPNVIHNDPGIIPGAVSATYVKDRLEEYGSEDSPLFQARVAGIWPHQGQYNLISLAWIAAAQRWDETKAKKALEEAVAREVEALEDSDDGPNYKPGRSMQRSSGAPSLITHRNKGAALGLDIAGEGSDLVVCTEIRDARAKILWWTVHRDLMETTGRIVRTIRDGAGLYRAVAIDDTGIGNGVSSRLLELQRWAKGENRKTNLDALALCAIHRVNFAHSPSSGQEERFHRIKDELWWDLREILRVGNIGLPTEAELRAAAFPKGVSLESQLVAPIYNQDSRGRLHVWDKRVDGKELTKHLPSRSPDVAHSLILARRAWKTLRTEPIMLEAAKNPVEVFRRMFRDKIASYRKPKPQETALGPSMYDHLDGDYS